MMIKVIALPDKGDLDTAVYNIVGQRVASLADGEYSAGYHSFTFDGSSLASGVYFVRAVVPGKLNQMQKVVLMK